MARYTITASETKAAIILKYLRELGGVKVEKTEESMQEEIVVHEWHKKIVDQRLKSVKQNPEQILSEKEMNKRMKKHLQK
jgi:hypothetical protein